MADNDFQYHAEDIAKRKARREREKQLRRNRYLEAYRKKLQQQKRYQQDHTTE